MGSRSNGLSHNWKEVLRSGQEYFLQNLERRGSADLRISDFHILKTIGTGGFGSVVLARDKSHQTVYAVKVLDKALVVEKEQVGHVLNEKKILQAIKFPFIVNLFCFFKDNSYLYFVMPFLAGGDLYTLLARQENKLSEQSSRFYAAQLVMSLEFLHSLGVAYRDLKPENVLLDGRGYIRLTDLGFCKVLGSEGRTFTICGTPEYLAPEVISCSGYGLAADMWSLGVLVWELCSGSLPFTDGDTLFPSILAGRTCQRPPWFSSHLTLLLEALINTDPLLRPQPVSVRQHPWFGGTAWDGILNKTEQAPFVPLLASSQDASYFQDYPETNLKTDTTDLYQDHFSMF